MLMAGALFASPPFKEALLRSAASWSTAVVADILSNCDAVVMSVLLARILFFERCAAEIVFENEGAREFRNCPNKNSYRTLFRQDVLDGRE